MGDAGSPSGGGAQPGSVEDASPQSSRDRLGIGKVVGIFLAAVVALAFVLVANNIRESRAARDLDTTPSVPGNSVHSVSIDGWDRPYTIHIPTDLPAGPVPLVLGLHGGTGSGQQFQRSSHLDAVADAQGFIVVYPEGVESRVDLTGTGTRTWNAGDCCGLASRSDVDDVAFIQAVIADVEDSKDIDPSRVVAIGHSNGGMLAYRLICESSEEITGIAVYGSTLTLDPCEPDHPVSLLAVHGSDDVNVPYNGGEGGVFSDTYYRPVLDSVTLVAAANGCERDPVLASGAQRTVKVWNSCEGTTSVEHVVLAGASHAWPGGPRERADASTEYDASAEMAAWLLDHPRRST